MIFSVACLESFGASSFPGAIKPTKKFGLVGTQHILQTAFYRLYSQPSTADRTSEATVGEISPVALPSRDQ
ncbi:hypothetical protein ALC53_07358 [Atta colombica]|uniref:Uncharacterized protein n=1 Tax=Atta colombica TaxID=520822 RepID=A0A195BD44_9HYME|nr:hypothetical protein ALC53_07358 [Atta colombica]